MPLQAFFHPAPDGGQRLYLHHAPEGGAAARHALVYLHPWAEEMNKSRRMAALASRALAADGHAVLQPDLKGCGDSSGDFGQASWDDWLDDTLRAVAWMRERHPGADLWLWGLRSGALLAAAAAAAPELDGERPSLLFWQPSTQGKAVLQQFLRLKAAAQLADGGGKAILAAARADLAAGRPVQVAGYALAPALASGLEAAQLTPPARAGGPARRAVWLDVSQQPNGQPSPATQAALERWRGAGWQVDARTVPGPAFWQTTEIEEAPALVAATRSCLASAPWAHDPSHGLPA